MGFKLGRSPHLLLLVTEETNGDWSALMAVPGALPKVGRITITLDDYEDNTEFDQNEITIQVTGLKAVTCNYAQIQAAIRKALQETPETYKDQRVYRLEDPTRWYLTTTEENANKLNKNTTTIENLNFNFTKRAEEKMTFRLLWVPPRLKMQTIERIVQSTFGAEATACRPVDTKDQGRVDVTIPYEKDFDPPHYLEVDRIGKQGKVEQTLWFVSVKGRRQQCHYCHSPHHWPIRCPTKNAPPKTRAEEVLGRRAEQTKTEPTRRAQQAPTNTVREPPHRADFVLLQETYIDTEPKFKDLLEKLGIAEGHQSPGTSRSKGVCTLKFSDKFNTINNSRDDHGRRSITEIESNKGQRYTIVNTYFPTKTEGNQQKFIEDAKTNFHQEGNIVWGGDFNIDEEEGTTTAQILEETMDSLQLKSTLPYLERDNPRHTFIHRNIELHTKRNLDRFYVPNPTDDIITRHIDTHKHTDHSAVHIERSNTSIGQQRRKSAYWKLNNTLLDIEECKKALDTTLEICQMEAEKCPEKAVEIWITTKDNIKKICTKIAKTENHKMKDKIKRLQGILDTQDLSAEYRHRLRQELDELEERKYRGAAIRCRIDMEQTDIATGYCFKERAECTEKQTDRRNHTGRWKHNQRTGQDQGTVH